MKGWKGMKKPQLCQTIAKASLLPLMFTFGWFSDKTVEQNYL